MMKTLILLLVLGSFPSAVSSIRSKNGSPCFLCADYNYAPNPEVPELKVPRRMNCIIDEETSTTCFQKMIELLVDDSECSMNQEKYAEACCAEEEMGLCKEEVVVVDDNDLNNNDEEVVSSDKKVVTNDEESSICILCGNSPYYPKITNSIFTTKDFGTYTCGEYYEHGIHSRIPENLCGTIQEYASQYCGCENEEEEEQKYINVPDNSTASKEDDEDYNVSEEDSLNEDPPRESNDEMIIIMTNNNNKAATTAEAEIKKVEEGGGRKKNTIVVGIASIFVVLVISSSYYLWRRSKTNNIERFHTFDDGDFTLDDYDMDDDDDEMETISLPSPDYSGYLSKKGNNNRPIQINMAGQLV